MQIRDLEYKTNLDRATIRFYEKQGLISPVRQENGYRIYSDKDCDTLLKIKLMRQLGMSVEKIRGLQQGCEDFSAALQDQIKALEQQIHSMHRSREVCIQIADAGADYHNLNAAYYLEILSRSDRDVKRKLEFKEQIPREYHPVRRLAARFTDYYLLSYFLRYVIVVVLRVRPFDDFFSAAITFGVWFLMIPLEALMLHRWGTTPGKWVMGLRVEAANGGNLTFRTALDREWMVLRYGLGFGIPIWELWQLYKSYRQYGAQSDMDWDHTCEYQYVDWKKKQKFVAAGIICLIACMTAFIANDAMKP